MLTCSGCAGFVPQGSSTCPNCQHAVQAHDSGDAWLRWGRTVKRGAVVACTSVTLAACYGVAADGGDYYDRDGDVDGDVDLGDLSVGGSAGSDAGGAAGKGGAGG